MPRPLQRVRLEGGLMLNLNSLHGEASLSRAQLPGRSASLGRTTPANKLLSVTSPRGFRGSA